MKVTSLQKEKTNTLKKIKEIMRERVCKNCGGREYKIVGQNMVKCCFCGTLYVDEKSNKEEEVLLALAREKARELCFDDAVKEFNKILSVFPLSFESFFGKCLAQNKIALYSSKKGTATRPRFFGELVSIKTDENFLQAIKLAPPEVAATFQKTSKQIEKIKKDFDEKDGANTCDIILCAPGFDKANPEKKVAELYENLQKSGKKVYFLQDLPQKELESQTFPALESGKVFLFFALNKSGYAEFKHLLDRWAYFVSLRKKPKTSFILAIDEWTIRKEDLPQEFAFCKNVIDTNSISFLQDVEVLLETEINNFVGQTAKIDTVKLKKVNPKKKEYVNIQTVAPTELGHYKVENLPLSETAKMKWIFLSLKNGDFETAKQLTDAELEKDSYSSQLLFAKLLAEKKIKTQEEFFSSISNFSDKETIDNILRYASKEFAQSFVDKWENLIVSLGEEEYYCAFLIYLASFQTPNRENFIKAAEVKAVETQNEDLIEKVLKCFNKEDVNRFVQFYFALAQKSDNQKYYRKILELDSGHFQSNMSVLLGHFKTPQDKLSYQNREEIEQIFQFLDENSRARIISAIVDLVLEVAFFDLEKAQAQLDFYLAYVADVAELVQLLKKIAIQFQQMKFFTLAEKYISLAISKDKQNGQLYWILILCKAHCRSENELITSEVKVPQMPEWETLLQVCDDAQNEFYAQYVSKANLFKGKRQPLASELLDKVRLMQSLEAFLLRNEKVLQEIEKQEGEKAESGVYYFRLQLKPFEALLKKIEAAESFEQFCQLVENMKARMDALDISLLSSFSVLQVLQRCENVKFALKATENEASSMGSAFQEMKSKQQKKKLLRRFFWIFFEAYPLLFTTLLLCFVIFLPKAVFMHFSQSFVVCCVVYCVFIGAGNLIYLVVKKKSLPLTMKAVSLSLFVAALINLILFCVGIYFCPKTIEISSKAQLQTLLKNANSANFVLTEDINMQAQQWNAINFRGTLDGKGHSILNIKLTDGFALHNSGKIENLKIFMEPNTIKNIDCFGAIAQKNLGQINNCFVEGTLTIFADGNGNFGALVGKNEGGKIFQCQSDVQLKVVCNGGQVNVGGLIGQDFRTKKAGEIEQNLSNAKITVEGQAHSINIGGLVGTLKNASKNNCVFGKISTIQFQGQGFVGGLVGKYSNSTQSSAISHSFAQVEMESGLTSGLLVGQLGGRMKNCFATVEGALEGDVLPYCGSLNCLNLQSKFYDTSLEFDAAVWNIFDDKLPELKWMQNT